jgi:organic hydroperoxide reductase OsmC/OhrA
MSYTVTVEWKKNDDEAFLDNKYSRGHTIIFDGGVKVPGSSSPHVVPLPMSVEAAVDPEEIFVASLSSCHMLWFLSLAAGKGFIVSSYEDNAEGMLGKNAEGKLGMTKVTLRPKAAFEGETIPSPEQIEQLHHESHESCFIANSVKTTVTVEPVQ